MDIINVKILNKYIKETLSQNRNLIIKTGDIEGYTPPSVLVGEYGYPHVSIGLLFSQENGAKLYDSPKEWVNKNYDVFKIFSLRNLLVNARDRFSVKDVSNQKLENMRLATIAKDEVAVKLEISKIHGPSSSFDNHYNISADINNLKIKDDVRIEKPVEDVYYDMDLKATDAIVKLYESKIDENKINKMLSVGAIGINRKVVPTKWSITAVDDTIGKSLIKEIKDYDTGPPAVKHGGILGNMFTFLFLPGKWSFELIEAWNNQNKLFMGEGDYELYEGRKSYAKNTAGGYYAARLAVLEKLSEMKSQYSVIVVREITPEYALPLGVWVVRESARNALKGELKYVDNVDTAIKAANGLLLYVKDVREHSKLLKILRNQRKLSEFI